VFFKRIEIVRAVYESDNGDAYYDQNHSEEHNNPALRIWLRSKTFVIQANSISSVLLVRHSMIQILVLP
jgi:hypothetical protein